jgi:hypothetical protein
MIVVASFSSHFEEPGDCFWPDVTHIKNVVKLDIVRFFSSPGEPSFLLLCFGLSEVCSRISIRNCSVSEIFQPITLGHAEFFHIHGLDGVRCPVPSLQVLI